MAATAIDFPKFGEIVFWFYHARMERPARNSTFIYEENLRKNCRSRSRSVSTVRTVGFLAYDWMDGRRSVDSMDCIAKVSMCPLQDPLFHNSNPCLFSEWHGLEYHLMYRGQSLRNAYDGVGKSSNEP